ncbi:MAG: MAPEG family protein [Sandaracinaceae bacterium]
MNPYLIAALMAAGVMPYVLTSVAKAGAFDATQNHRTRGWQSELSGWRQRAHWAHNNAFEVFPLFVTAVFVSALAAPESPLSVGLAWGFVGTRVLFSAFYLKDWARPRSMSFHLGMACVLGLFIDALRT